MPFKLREFMVKNWKRHRDVPTTIDELVDKTFDDLRARKLDLTQRSQVNAIKPEKLMKVITLLNDIRKVVEKVPFEVADPGFMSLRLKINEVNATEDETEKEVVDVRQAHRDLILRGQLGPRGKAQYDVDLKNKQILTKLTIISKKRKRNSNEHGPVEQSFPECNVNDVTVEQSLPECKVNDNNMAESPVFVCVPAKAQTKTLKPKKLEHHQTKLSDYGTKRIDLRLLPEEVNWLLAECALRPCFTWGDGYCGYRSAAAIRNTTMKELLADVTSVLERRGGDTYQHKHPDSEPTTVVLPDSERDQWLKQLQYVSKALSQCIYTIHSTYYCRDDIFEIIAGMDDMCILFVNTSSLKDNPRYRVYSPNVMQTCSTLQEVADVLSPFRDAGTKIRGVGYGNAHYCALFPATQEPNFAGDNCLGQWE